MSGRFATTRWSVVLAAQEGSPSQARSALAALCEAYWEPLYALTRRRGYDAEEARDLTQGFFARLLGRDFPAGIRPSVGKLRSFLLVSLENYLANERDKARALKRGGGAAPFSLDAEAAESCYRAVAVDHLTPEKVFERRWALTMIARVMARLRQEAAAADREEQFEQLKGFVTGVRPRKPYREVADALRVSESAVRVAVHRLRRRFGEVLRGEIAETVADSEDVDGEIRHLISVLG